MSCLNKAYTNVVESVPDAYALRCIPEATAREHQWLAYHFNSQLQQLRIVTPRIPGKLLQQRAQMLLSESVQPEKDWAIQWNRIASNGGLSESIQRAYAESHILDEISANCAASSENEYAQMDDDQWPIGRWFDALLNDAVHRRASDIHIQVNSYQFEVHYRIDGVMQMRTQLPHRLWKFLLARVKVLSQLDLTEHRRPQEGAFERIIHGCSQPIRVALMPHLDTEKITLRLQRSHHALPKLADLFVLKSQRQLVLNALHRQQGLVLVAGATGSGKTTTLYSCLMEWMAMGLNLITLEDPIEVTLPGVCQSSINTRIGYSFSDALRAALRHDPDGLLVGEIRDDETCALAIRAALSGHPVLASVHASDAVGVIKRLMGLGATLLDLQETVQIIIVQRLARIPCACAGLEKKCVRCLGSGYYGRVAAAEIAATQADFFDHSSDWIGVRQQLQLNYLASLKQLLDKKHIDKREHDRIVQTLRLDPKLKPSLDSSLATRLDNGRQGCQDFV